MPTKQPQLEAFSKILGMLEEVIFNGTTGDPSREFYTAPHPGIFVNPKLTETANSKDMLLASEMVDACFAATLRYEPLITTVSQTYSDILEQAALPEKNLTPTQLADLQDTEKRLDASVDVYLKYKDRYDKIKGDIFRAQSAAEPADVIYALEQKRLAALEEWKRYGKKQQYESDDAKVNYLRSVSPKLHFQKLKQRFDAFSQTTGVSDFQPIYLDPPISDWNSPYAGWASFSKTFKYSELHTLSKNASWSGSAGADFGVWRVGGAADGSSTEKYENSEDTDIELKFEYMRVAVRRPWLISDIFMYRFWTYNTAFGFRAVSEGFDPGAMPPLGPKGLMPVLPTNFVVARNVSISASFSAAEKSFVSSTLSGSVSGGWGPFSARGSYSTTTTKEDVIGSFDGTTLRIANPQIIGLMGILLPRSPNPDRRLPWGADADFGDATASALIAADSGDYIAELEAQYELTRHLYDAN